MAVKRTLGYRRVVLFEHEGASMVSSWTDIIELTRRKDASFTLRLVVVPFCREDGRQCVAYRSRPFRAAEVFLKALDAAARSRDLDLYEDDMERIVEAIAPLDEGLRGAVQQLLTPEPQPEHPRCAEWRARHRLSTERDGAAAQPGRVIDLWTFRPRILEARRLGRPLDGSITAEVAASREAMRRWAISRLRPRLAGQEEGGDAAS